MPPVAAVSWKDSHAAMVTGGRVTCPWSASGVSIDSRTVAPGELFVALVGERFDGHDYIKAAMEAGAAAAMVSRVPDSVETEWPLLVVPNTNVALFALGAAGRQRSRATVVGITGSVGKTGTKEMLRLALSAFGSVHASLQSYNNSIGVPLTLANLPADADFAVIEMGMNHGGEISVLSKLSRPHIVVITTVAAAHLGNFENMSEIAKAKAEIFDGIEPEGAAVLNQDNGYFQQLCSAARGGIDEVIGFGRATGATIRLTDYIPSPGRNTLSVEVAGQMFVYQLGADGLHWAHNSLAVLGVIYWLGKDTHSAAGRLALFRGMEGRGLRHSIDLGDGKIELIDDSYNASPVSMMASIELLGASQPKCAGRRIAILGEMLELGSGGGAFHAKLADAVIAADVALTFTVGRQMSHLRDALSPERCGAHAEIVSQIIGPAILSLRQGDVVLVKGSQGTGMGDVVRALLAASDDHGVSSVNRIN